MTQQLLNDTAKHPGHLPQFWAFSSLATLSLIILEM